MAVEHSNNPQDHITLHSRTYALPSRPTVIICIDGFDPSYLSHGLQANILPTFQTLIDHGFHATAKSAMPSFTNPNNVSIVTGVPPAVHGIAGNFFLDRETGQEHMIVDDELLRGGTILELMAKKGNVRVAAVTAKDKLRKILAHALDFEGGNNICFSAERVSTCSLSENGIENVEDWIGRPQPTQYSGDLSLYVLDAGVKLLQENRADLFYLTLSDYIQHKYPPGVKESNDFLQAIDARIQKLLDLGAVVAVTGDHGMADKSTADGKPNVLFLEDELHAKFGSGVARVICPITDPFVKHHGALGSFVRVYLNQDASQRDSSAAAGTATLEGAMLEYCKSLPQVAIAMTGKEAAEVYEMPLDREGDLVVISKGDAVIGSKRSEHDLSNIGDHPLRSHGGITERDIPLLVSKPVEDVEAAGKKAWRNYDIFDLALNWVA